MAKPRIYIAIVNFHPLVGGAERQALLQGRALRARGCDATVVTLRHDRAWPRQEVVEGVPVLRVAGAIIAGRQRLPAPLRKLAFMFGILAMAWALWWRRRNYDLLHVYQLSVLALPAAFVCWLTGKPLIVSQRCANATSLPSSGHTGRTGRSWSRLFHTRTRLARLERIQGDLQALERLGEPAVRMTRYLLRRTGAVVVVLSSRMRADLAAHGFPTDGVQVIPNGVDLERFRPVAIEALPAQRGHTVLYVGRLTYQKGVDVLLHAWRSVQEQLSRCEQAHLTIVGIGPSQAQLEQLARTLGIAESVEFAGLQLDIGMWLRQSHLVVLPSRWEGMPNAVLEAMASSLPCIATRVSGSEDIIVHGVNGLLVEPEDQQGLAQALLSLLRNPGLRRQYGHAARATIEKCYSLDRITDIYLELYQRMCSGTQRPAMSAVIAQASLTTEAEG